MEIQGSHRTLLYRQPSRKHISSYSTILVRMDASPKKVTFDSDSSSSKFGEISKKEMVITLPVKSYKLVPKGTQTDYRESEAQTLPWRHEIRADKKLMEEFLALDSFSLGTIYENRDLLSSVTFFNFLEIKCRTIRTILERNFPLGMKEVSLIERTRQKLAWENVIARLKGKENNFKRKSLVGKLAEAEILFREREMDEMHRERMKLSYKLLSERLKENEDELQRRLLKSYRARKSENDEKIDYWKRQLSRELRKIKFKREEFVSKSRKRDIVSAHLDKTSEIYAPNIRDGENPARGHEVIDIQCRYLKRFHGLKILETHLPGFFEPERNKHEFEKASKSNKVKICLKKFRSKTLKYEIFPFEMHEENVQEPVSLKKPITEGIPRSEAGRVRQERSDLEEDLYQASVLLEKIIKGRAIQTKKFLEIYSKK